VKENFVDVFVFILNQDEIDTEEWAVGVRLDSSGG
jgi:hypothetical protein